MSVDRTKCSAPGFARIVSFAAYAKLYEFAHLVRFATKTAAALAFFTHFADQSHFTRVFSKSEGYSPGRWRRLHRY